MADDLYPMSSGRRGQFIIISNENFVQPRGLVLPPLTGNGKDVERLETVFSQLEFTVAVHKDVGAVDMQDLMQRAASTEDQCTKPCDCFGVAVLSHGGDQGIIYGADAEEISVDNFVEAIKRCRALVGKPKIFFFQTCRGGKVDAGYLTAHHDGNTTVQFICIPTEADFLYAYPTPEGYLSWGDAGGSWFIQVLCKMLNKHSSSLDLVRILTRVNRCVATDKATQDPSKPDLDKWKQMPSFVSMLTRELKF